VKLSLVAFGKLKTPGLREAADYYRGLVRTLVSIEEIELKPIPVPDKSATMRRKVQEKEGEFLLQRLEPILSKGRTALYLIDETGKSQPTQGWASWVRTCEADGLTELVVCVGGSLGFSQAVRDRARGILGLGPQTLSHELARVVLLEQLYRAWGVTRGHPYHNEGS
jgi:23S rRNA (pseudouridine1915-N3)-methyltransferase